MRAWHEMNEVFFVPTVRAVAIDDPCVACARGPNERRGDLG